ncbi:MAG TPA: hypothetical protein VIS76_04555 [Pseudomonadales bacterium]
MKNDGNSRMQDAGSIARNLLRIVFRGGSPQRVPYADSLFRSALAALVIGTGAASVTFFAGSVIETGLALFTLMCGLYIGAAALTRWVPRSRLRVSLQAVLLVLAAAQLVLIVMSPLLLAVPAGKVPIAISVAAAALVGTTNTVQYALGSRRTRAALTVTAFAVGLGAFYAVLRSLLQVLYTL